MMAEKAKLFGDEDIWRQVMATDDPRYVPARLVCIIRKIGSFKLFFSPKTPDAGRAP